MNDKFEMPVDPRELRYNFFAMDDFIRQVSDPEERRRIILKHGCLPELRKAYENENDLPMGALSLALMADDKRVQRINDLIHQGLEKDSSPEGIQRAYAELCSCAKGLANIYPEAMEFLSIYQTKVSKLRESFKSSYAVGNGYRLFTLDSGPNPPLVVNINVGVNVNVGANVAVGVNVAAVALVVVAAAVFVFGFVFLYGQKSLSSRSWV